MDYPRAYMSLLVRALLFPAFLAIGVGLSACAAPASPDEEDVESLDTAATSGPATALVATSGSETRVRAAGMSLWVETVSVPRRVGADVWITVRLRTSRSLESAMSFVPDDGFGDARLVSPRVVEIDLRGGHEINSILSGLPLFVHLRAKSGAVRDYEARLDLAPRFARFAGPGAVSIDRDIRPVLVKSAADDLRYRGRVTSSGATSMNVYTDDDSDPEVAAVGPGAWRFDWTYSNLELASDIPTDSVFFGATTGASTKTKTAGIDLAVVKVGLTKDSAYDVWPPPACTPAVATCIQGKAAGATDFGDCGAYRQVKSCIQQLACEPQLYPRPLGALAGVAAQLNATCAGGGSWCSLSELRTFDAGGCDVGSTTLAHVTKATKAVLAESAAADQGFEGVAGPALTRTQLSQTTYFQFHLPTLLAKIDAAVGSTNVVATELVSEVPCHNCHEFKVRYVLFYPDTQTVIVVEGTRGYDS